jgi:hypothetical protein
VHFVLPWCSTEPTVLICHPVYPIAVHHTIAENTLAISAGVAAIMPPVPGLLATLFNPKPFDGGRTLFASSWLRS